MILNNKILIGIIFPLGLFSGYFLRGAFIPDQHAPNRVDTNKYVSSAANGTRDTENSYRPEEDCNLESFKANSQRRFVDESDEFDQEDYSEDEGAEPLDYLKELGAAVDIQDVDERLNRMRELLDGWANEDLDSAFEWLSAQEYTEEIDEFYYIVVSKIVEKDIDAAGDIILGLPDSYSKENLINEYVYKLAGTDTHRALNWTSSIYKEELRHNAQYQLLQAWIESSPAEVLDYIPTIPDLPDNLREEIVAQAASGISQSDHVVISSSISQYPESIQPQIAYGLIGNWIDKDIDGARSWVESLQEGATKDKAIQGYIDYANDEPNSVFQLTESIANESSRIALMSRAFENWYYSDPHAAESALNASSKLNDDQKQLLIGKAKLN